MAKRRLYGIRAVAQLLDVSETTVRKLLRIGHLPQPKQVAGTIPKWTHAQVQGYLYALEHDLLPAPAAESCQAEKPPRKAAPGHARRQNEPSEGGG